MKGQIWISAILYIALGVIAISIVLSAGVPLINKLKDKNTILQTRDLMFNIDNIIRDIRDEGPGSKRVIQPFIIKDGNFFFNTSSNKIQWNLNTNAIFTEPCGKNKKECTDNNLILKEGPIEIYQTSTIIEDEYVVNLEMDYKNVGFLVMKTDTGKDTFLLGRYTLTIENSGVDPRRNINLPDIGISVV